MELHVLYGNRTIDLYVSPNSTIHEIKNKIESKEGLVADKQDLVFKGKRLEDNKRINEYAIQDGASIQLYDIKPKPSSDLVVYIKPINSQPVPLSPLPTDTIKELKDKIYYKNIGPPAKDQILIYKGRELLETDKGTGYNLTLQDYSIASGDAISLITRQNNNDTINIKVQESGYEAIPLQVNPNITVSELKNIIKDKKNIPPASQTLYYHGSELKDEKALIVYDIKDNETINLKYLIQLIVKNIDGSIFMINIDPNANVTDLKKAIEEKSQIPTIDQRLVYKAKQLLDEKNLQDYCINDHDTINILVRLKGGKI